jgi:hypothetical protein
MDPLVAIVMDSKAMDLASTLVAKLEHVSYDETRRGVFRTQWAHSLFSTCMKRLAEQDAPQFQIDEWYSSVRDPKSKTDYTVSPDLLSQTVDTNWLVSLFQKEIEVPGFMLLLHNTLHLEDQAHIKLAAQSKTETEYDFIGLGQRNRVLAIQAAPAKKKRETITDG